MAISQQQKDEILSVVVSLFNGAPGGAILDDLAKAVEDGVPIYEISRLLAETNQFKALTSDKTTIPQQVEFLLDHFGFAPGGEPGSAAALAEEYFTLRIEAGANLGHIVYEAVNYLQNDPAPVFANTVQLLNNKVQVANIHSENYRDIASVEEAISVMNGIVGDKAYTPEEIRTILSDKLDGGTGDGSDNGGGDGDDSGSGDTGGDTGGGSGGGGGTPAPTFTVTENATDPEAVIVGFQNAGSTISAAASTTKLAFTSNSTTRTTASDAEKIAEIQVGSGKTLSSAAAVLDGIEIAGAGNTTITGSDGDQTLIVKTTGTNSIAGGKGGDVIILGEDTGTDTVKVAGGSAGGSAVVALADAEAALAAARGVATDEVLEDNVATAAAGVGAAFAETVVADAAAPTALEIAAEVAALEDNVATAAAGVGAAFAETVVADAAAPTALEIAAEVAALEDNVATAAAGVGAAFAETVVADAAAPTALEIAAEVAALATLADSANATYDAETDRYSGGDDTGTAASAYNAFVTLVEELATENDALGTFNGLVDDLTDAEDALTTFNGLVGDLTDAEDALATFNGLVDDLTDAEDALTTFNGLVDDLTDAEDALATFNGLADDLTDAEDALTTFNGLVDDLTDAEAAWATREGLIQDVADAEAAIGSGVYVAADSNATNMDSIVNFDLAMDKLDLDVTTLFSDLEETTVSGVTFSVTDGIVSVTGVETLNDVLTALATQMDNQKATVTYFDGEDTYIFQGDGAAGLADSDTVVKIVGVEVMDLAAILV